MSVTECEWHSKIMYVPLLDGEATTRSGKWNVVRSRARLAQPQLVAKRLVYEHASCLFTKYDLFLDIGRYSIVAFRLPLRCEDF